MTFKKNVFFGKSIFLPIPFQDSIDLPTCRSSLGKLCLQATVRTKGMSIRIIPDMARMNEYEILAMLSIGAMSICRNNSPHSTMIKWESPKMFRDEDDGVALAFVQTERPGRKNFPFSKPSDLQKIIQASHKAAVTEHHAFDDKISENRFDVNIRGKHSHNLVILSLGHSSG